MLRGFHCRRRYFFIVTFEEQKYLSYDIILSTRVADTIGEYSRYCLFRVIWRVSFVVRHVARCSPPATASIRAYLQLTASSTAPHSSTRALPNPIRSTRVGRQVIRRSYLAENSVMRRPLCSSSNPSLTHSWLRMMRAAWFVLRNSWVTSCPNSTPAPLADSCRPWMGLGSDHSIASNICRCVVMGLSSTHMLGGGGRDSRFSRLRHEIKQIVGFTTKIAITSVCATVRDSS